MKASIRNSLILSLGLLAAACASKTTLNSAGLEKYPLCYSKIPKLSNACIEKNEAGENVTALQLENAAYPGQYN